MGINKKWTQKKTICKELERKETKWDELWKPYDPRLKDKKSEEK